MKQIEDALQFIVELEKLKDVHRKTRPVGLGRYENSAEHSWHVCMLAIALKDHTDEPINIDRVLKMLLIHDIGEIDAGDTIIYKSENAQLKQEEAKGVKRLLDFLPAEDADAYMQLWQEFEEGQSADARFAKAMDRIPPLLQNIYGGGHAWKENNINKDMVFSLNSRIAKSSKNVWQVVKGLISQSVDKGLLK